MTDDLITRVHGKMLTTQVFAGDEPTSSATNMDAIILAGFRKLFPSDAEFLATKFTNRMAQAAIAECEREITAPEVSDAE